MEESLRLTRTNRRMLQDIVLAQINTNAQAGIYRSDEVEELPATMVMELKGLNARKLRVFHQTGQYAYLIVKIWVE